MKSTDRNLGMDRRISRRDLPHGVGFLAATSLAPGRALADELLGLERAGAGGYPPALTGLRGSHIGSFEAAHALARNGKTDWGPVHEPDSGIYDLVVVGGGISGLAAAYFYRKAHPGARILILDNHDDFGGHAKRNEIAVGGRTLLGYGGSQTLEAPSDFSDVVKTLLGDLGVDIERFYAAYDQDFYRRNDLSGGVYFGADDWGAGRLVRYDLGGLGGYLPLAPSILSAGEAVDRMPISEPARREILRLLVTEQDRMPEVPADEKEDYLYEISYREFLSRHLDIHEPEVFAVFQNLATESSVGIESTAAGEAIYYSGLPGKMATGIPEREEDEPYIHHFPDGNASIARLLVRAMIPAVAPGSTMEDVVTTRFDYSLLDTANSSVRLRLSSTVTRVENDGDPQSAKRVCISYVRGDRACRVQARCCVLACNNSMIPYLCPELPASQREALALQVRSPILYTKFSQRNWQAWKKLGIGAVVSPGGYHANAMLDFPVSLGDYRFSSEAGDPIAVHMERFPHRPNEGLSEREQRRRGRHELLATSFETIERNIRSQLADTLADGGFDPARDIEGITVNRWPHGYADGYTELEAPSYADRNDER
ncbi:MAG: NAD(P)/FAD-dependent oxidoreductase [Proteobacteria bacterium]|nr:NAD(P)/FAD-dependent oxidoreductase [Pseudomonadota bacterium]